MFRVEGFRLSRLRIGRFRALGRTGLTALTFASWWGGGIVWGFGHFTVELGLRVWLLRPKVFEVRRFRVQGVKPNQGCKGTRHLS